MHKTAPWFGHKHILLLLSLLSLLSTGFGPPVLTDSDVPVRRVTSHQLRTMRQMPPPELSAPPATSPVTLTVPVGEICPAPSCP